MTTLQFKDRVGPPTIPGPTPPDHHPSGGPGPRSRRRLAALLILLGILVVATPVAVVAVVARGDARSTITPAPVNPPAAAPGAPAAPSAEPAPPPGAGPTAKAWSPGRYTAVRLPRLAGSTNYGTFGLGLNEQGLAVGQSEASNGRPHPVLWDHGRIVDLGVLAAGPEESGVARDINVHGDIVGASEGPDGQRAVLWRDGQIIDLGTLSGSVSSFAYAINDRGQVVGTSRTASGELRGFLWHDGVMRDLGIDGGVLPTDINNHGQVVGELGVDDGGSRQQAFLWQDTVLTRLTSPGLSSRATAINDRGEIVGSYDAVTDEVSLPVRWYRGATTELGTLSNGNAGVANAINARGQIVGGANIALHSMEEHAFIWWRGFMHDLTTYGVPANAAYVMADVNDRGQVLAGDMVFTPA